MALSLLAFLLGILGETNIVDLVKLMFWPEILQKLSRTSIIACYVVILARPNSIRSSVKKMCNRRKLFLEALIPFQFPSSSLMLIITESLPYRGQRDKGRGGLLV